MMRPPELQVAVDCTEARRSKLPARNCQCGRRNYFGTAERRNYSALAWRNTKTIDIFNFEDGEMRALQRRIF